MKITKEHLLLALLFLITLGVRLFFVFQAQAFDYDAYYTLRQAEHIRETGFPILDDPLSYSGRTFLTLPLVYYVLAGFSFIIPLELAAKILPSLFFAALVIVIFLIAKHVTKNKTAALISALFAGFVPIILTTVNQVSVYSLGLLLIFLLSYTFLRIEEKGFTLLSIILTILLLLTHTLVFLLLIAFFVYFVILILEKQKVSSREAETALFLFFLALWFNILLYKKAFFLHGISFIWQNIPAPLLSSYFTEISFFGVIYAVGVLPLLLGVYAIYNASFKTKNRAAMLYTCFALVSFIMLWLKITPIRTGLLLLSLNLIILSASSIKTFIVSLTKTKAPGFASIFIGLIILLFVLTTAPSFISTPKSEVPPEADLAALKWMRNNTDANDVVLGRVEEGFLINYLAERKNVADSNFLFIEEINSRYEDINKLFTLRLKSEAVRLINKYNIDYIFLSTKSMKEYNVSRLYYADKECFKVVYDKDTYVYHFLGCEI